MKTKNNLSENGGYVEFEDAVSLTEYGRYNIFLLLICGGLLMAVIMETMSMSYILPAAQCDLDLTLADKSILSMVSFLGVVLSSLLWGFIGDTIGRRNVVIFTTYISFIMTTLSSLSPYIWSFILLRFLNGFFIGGPSAVTYAYLGEFHNNSHRARVLSWAAAFIAVATITLPALAWLILPMDWFISIPGLTIRPWRLLVILYGLPGVISATLLLRYPESPKFLWVNGKVDKVLEILQDMYQSNTGNPKEMYPVTRIVEQTEKIIDSDENRSLKPSKQALALLKSMWEQTAPLFQRPLILKSFMTCTLQFGVFASSSGFLMWTPDILNKVSYFMEQNTSESVLVCDALRNINNSTENVDENDTTTMDCSDFVNEEVFKISLILGAVFGLGYILIGIIINKTGKKLLLVAVLSLSGLSGLTLNFAESYMVIVIVLGLFLMAGTCVGIINTVVVDLYPTQYRAMAMAISLMMGRFGAVLGANVIGHMLEYSCELTIYVFAGEYLILVTISLMLPIPLILNKTNPNKLNVSIAE